MHIKPWMYFAIAGLGYYWYSSRLTPVQQLQVNQRNTGPMTQQGTLPPANMGSKTQMPVNAGAGASSNLPMWA